MSHHPTTDQVGPPDEVEIRVVNLGDAPVPEVELAPPGGPEWSAPAATPEPSGGVQPGVQIVTPERVAQTIVAGSKQIADRRGRPYWAYSREEADLLADPLAGELNDLFRALPGVGRAADALGGRRAQLVAAVAITAGPRLVMDVLTPSEREREAAAEDLARREQRRERAPLAADAGRPTPTQPTTPAGGVESWGDTLRDLPAPGS
ncbi:MAG: hypothetical protein M0R73_02650 [Dehalococcoidia bacterium]|nr:hypothetical protein [Dehalococcoidia bacterium]